MVRNVFRSLVRFMRLVRHAPVEQSHRIASRETAERLRGAVGVSCSGAYGSGGNSNIDGLLDRELAAGRERARKEIAPPKPADRSGTKGRNERWSATL